MIVHDVEQRSPEWYALRCARIGSSDAGDLMAPSLKNGNEPARRRDLRLQKICEQLTGRSAESDYINDAMQRGIDMEPVALARYEAYRDRLALKVGYCSHDKILAGCSPDARIGDFDGLVEVKCPKSATHLSYLRGGVVPYDYQPQILHQLWITGARYVDFVSFDDRFPESLQLFVVRHMRDEKELEAYELILRVFLTEIEREVESLRGLVPAA